jgi:Flp pilus assembly protein TadG
MAVIFPVTILIIFGIIQFGVWYHANQIARAAAQQGVRTSSAYGANQAAGTEEARTVLSENGPGLVTHAVITSQRGQQVATVTVRGQSLQVIPFIPLPVTATATSPVEKFRTPPRG